MPNREDPYSKDKINMIIEPKGNLTNKYLNIIITLDYYLNLFIQLMIMLKTILITLKLILNKIRIHN